MTAPWFWHAQQQSGSSRADPVRDFRSDDRPLHQSSPPTDPSAGSDTLFTQHKQTIAAGRAHTHTDTVHTVAPGERRL